MPLPNQIAPHAVRETCIRLIETERLLLRAPRTEDAPTIAILVNDRRIAENTLRIPHPYGIADARRFITGANAGSGETVFLIVRRDTTVLGVCGLAKRAAESAELGYWLALHSGAMAMPPKRRVPSSLTPSTISATRCCTPGRA